MNGGKNNGRFTILCIFALSCVAILLVTSLIAIVPNNGNEVYDDSTMCSVNGTTSICSEAYANTYTNDKGYLVGVCDGNEDSDCATDDNLLGAPLGYNVDIRFNNLEFETHSGNEAWVVNYKLYNGWSGRDYVVPDYLVHNGQTYKVTRIFEHAFSSSCVFVPLPHSVEIGSTIRQIDDKAFSAYLSTSDTKLENFSIRDVEHSQLERICHEAFDACNITSITLPATLKAIDEEAFQDCSKLENVTIAGSTEPLYIGYQAFNGCGNIKTVTIGERSFGITICGQAFQNCSSLSSFSNFHDVVSIGGAAFLGCRSLEGTTLDLPNVESIGGDAFHIGDRHFQKIILGGFLKKFGGADYGLWSDPFGYDLFDEHGHKLSQKGPIENFVGRTFINDRRVP